MAALAFVNRQSPADSPLLAKAVTPHGPAALPPLRNPQAPAFRLLGQWARLAANERAVPAEPCPALAPFSGSNLRH